MPAPSSADYAMRSSGLLVPTKATLPSQRHQRIMAREKFRKLLRMMRYSHEANLRALFVCRGCNDVVQLKRGEHGLIETDRLNSPVNEKTDAFSLTCKCTVWTVRG